MNQQANINRAEHKRGENQTFSPVNLSLIGQIQGLARRLQRLVWLSSIAESIFQVVVCLVVGVLLDWWFRPVHWAGRFTITTITFLGVACAVTFAVRRLKRQRMTPLAVARRIEAIHPGLGDRLSSAVALEGRAATGDTSDLARVVIQTASVEFQQVEPAKQIDRGPAFRSTVLAMSAVLLGSLWIFGNPLASTLAAKRLLAPVGEAKWPQQNHLRLENVPSRVFLGEDVEIFVSDTSGAIPADTEIQFRLADDSVLVPPLRMHGNRGAAVLQNVQSKFEVRAHGGDDDSLDWYVVEVTAAPRIDDYRVTLVPPGYSQRTPLETQDTQLQLLAGTELSISATVRPAVSRAKLVASPLGRSDVIGEWEVQVDATGERLVVDPIVLTSSQSLRFVWADRSGLSGQSIEQWKITITQDALPMVTMLEPAVDLEIIPGGLVELVGEVTDDLGLVERWVEVRHLESSRRTRVAQQTFEDRPLVDTWKFSLDLPLLNFPDAEVTQVDSADTALTQSSSIQKTDKPIAPGDTLEVLAVAIDSAGQRGESTIRRLRIISDSMLSDAMAKREREVLESLQAATRQQETALEQTEAARSRLGESTEQRQAASDRIRSAEAAQRNAQAQLTEGLRSARQELENALSAAKNNRRDDPHLQEAKARLEDITDRAMETAEESLREANRQWASDERSSQVREATDKALQQARDAQQESLDQLNRWVAELRQADAQRAAVEELTDLVAQQERLAEATSALSTASDQTKEIARLAARQRELARNAEGMPTKLRELAQTVADLQPVFAARAVQAAQVLEQGDTGQADTSGGAIGAMRQAAAELQQGRSGRVEGLQQQASKELDNARRALQGLKGTQEQQAESSIENSVNDQLVTLKTLYSKQLAIVESLTNQQWTGLAELELANSQSAAEAAREFKGAPGFRDSIEDSMIDMQMAAAILARTGQESEAEEPAVNALERLRIIVESLSEAGQENGPNGEMPNESTVEKDPTDPQQSEPQPSTTIPIASLRLARSTQEFLLRRTAELKSKEALLDEESPQGNQRRLSLQAAKRRLAEEQALLVQRIELYAEEIMAAQNSASPAPPEQP